MVVIAAGAFQLFGVLADELLLLTPTLIHTFQAPFRAPLRHTNGAAAHADKERIRVGGAEDPERDPTAPLDRGFKCDITKRAVGCDALAGDTSSVDDRLDGDFARAGDAGVLGSPLRLLTARPWRAGLPRNVRNDG